MALIDSFFIPDYVQMQSGLTSPSELVSEVITVVDLPSSPISVQFSSGTILVNGVDVGSTAGVNENDTFQLKVTNPTLGQETSYNFIVAGSIQMEWRVTLYDTSTLSSETNTSSVDSDSNVQIAETLETTISQEPVAENEANILIVSEDAQPENETSEQVTALEQVIDIASTIKTALEESIAQSVTLATATTEAEIVAEKDIADLFDKQSTIVELTEILNTEKLAEVLEDVLVDENIKQAIKTDDALKDFVTNIPEQVVDTIVTEVKETLTREVKELVETKSTEIAEIVEKAAVKVLEPFVETEILTVVEKLVTEDTDRVDLSEIDSSELTEIESVFVQFFFENLETDAVNQINVTELTVKEFLQDQTAVDFVETVLVNDVLFTEETVKEDLQKTALEFLKDEESLLEQTFVVPLVVDELDRLGISAETLRDEFTKLPTGETDELLESILIAFEAGSINLGSDQLPDEPLSTQLGEDDVTDDSVTVLIGEDDVTDDSVTVLIGEDDVTDDSVTVLTGEDDIDDTVLTTEIGEDDVVDDTITTQLGEDDVTDDSVTVLTGEDDVTDETTTLQSGEDDITDDTTTILTGEDDVTDDTVTVVAGEEDLSEDGVGGDPSLVGAGLPKGVIRLRDGILTFYHLRPVTILGEITGINSVIGPFIDRDGINRNMKL